MGNTIATISTYYFSLVAAINSDQLTSLPSVNCEHVAKNSSMDVNHSSMIATNRDHTRNKLDDFTSDTNPTYETISELQH